MVDERDPISRPWHITEEEWLAVPPGVRVRAMRYQEEYFHLTAEQYRELSRLPFWMFYGPEQGLPVDWFNDRSFILPRYRPGGPDYEEFRSWRHRFRSRRWRRYLAAQKFRRVDQVAAPFGLLIGGGAYLLVGASYGLLAGAVAYLAFRALTFLVFLLLQRLFGFEPLATRKVPYLFEDQESRAP